MCYNISTIQKGEKNMATVTLFIDWDKKEALTEKEIGREVKKRIEEAISDSMDFEEFLENQYGRNQIFAMSKEEKREVSKEFKTMQETNTTNRVFSRYHKIVIDTKAKKEKSQVNTMTLYINYEERKIYTEAEMQEKIDEAMEELSVTDCGEFDEFLMGNYSCVELFNMPEEEKAEIFDAYVEDTRERVELSLYRDCGVAVIDLDKGTILNEEFY